MDAKPTPMLFRLLFLTLFSCFICVSTANAQRSLFSKKLGKSQGEVNVQLADGWASSSVSSDGRYGFHAAFEVRVAPGTFKTLHIRQYFTSQESANDGLSAVRSALPENSHLVYLTWVYPTDSSGGLGQ